MAKGNPLNAKSNGTPPNYTKKLAEMKEKNAAAQAELRAKYLQQMRESTGNRNKD